MNDQNLGQMFFDRAKLHATGAAFRVKKNGAYVDVGYREAAERVSSIAAGFLTVPGGLARRAGVGILGPTSMDWIACDYAALSIDCLVAPIYATLLPAEIGYILIDAAVEVLVVENKKAYDKVKGIAGGFTFFDKAYAANAFKLRHFVVIDPSGMEQSADWESLADLEARGRAKLGESEGERRARLDAIKRTDVATYGYTSGTTGPPKGVIQTHHNWLSLLEVSSEMGIFTEHTRHAGCFLFLPLAHSFGRLIEFAGVYHGGPLIISGVDTLADDLKLSRPGFVPAAPRVYEKVYARLMGSVSSMPPMRQKMFHWAVAVGKQTIPYRSANQSLPLGLRAKHALADRLVLSKLRARIGLDRVEGMLSGSAPLAPAVHELFIACGMMLYEAYGLTETCPGLTANRPGKWKLGTVGQPLRNIIIKIASDGEILAKGPNVTSGYLNRPDANKDAFDDEGWFHTGDVGEFDSEGYLRITDRKKDLLKTSGGKYVAPQKIEGLLKSKPMISEAVVIGDNKKYCTVLLVLDDDTWKQWADKRGKKMDPRDTELNAELQKSIDEVNRDLASFESIKYFRVVDQPFTVESGLLTASFKVKRKEVNKRFDGLITEMYSMAKPGEKEAA
jgi:long-chain acyl-CoA synthetase